MSTFELTIYQTNDLYWTCDSKYGDPTRAQERAKTYIEGAFSYAQHDVVVNLGDAQVNAPQEKVLQSFDGTTPCTSMTGTYGDLAEWWHDYFEMCDRTFSADVDLLLTDYNGQEGKCANNRAACSEGGPTIADLPSSYQQYGDTTPFDSMQTAMHEFLHGILGDTAMEHDVGITYEHGSTLAKTPNARPGEKNQCADYVDQPNAWEMRYSDCAESNMSTENGPE